MTSIEPSEQENSPDGSSGKTPAVAPPRGKPLSPEHTDISRLSSDLLSSGQLDMSQWVTLPHMQAVRPGKGSSLPSHPGDATDDDPLEASATWILPIITGQHPAAPSSGRLQAIISDTSARLQAVVPGAEGYIALLRNLAKSSGIYALAALASPLISLVLAPFLTRHLSPADYGLLAIMNTLIGLTAGVTQLGLSSAFFRAYSYDYSSREDRNSVLTTVAMILALITIPVAIIVSIYAPTIGALLFGRSSAGSYIALAAGVVLLQNMTVPGFAWLRAENRPLFFSLLAIGNLIIALTANIVFIGVFKLGITGSLLATGSGYAFIVLLTIPLILLRAGLRVRLDVAWNVLSFGTPMVMNFISFWVLQLSDRYLLSKFGSLEQTATYTVAYSLGSVLSTAVISPFSLAWPQTMFTVAKRRDAAKIFRLIFRWFSLFLLLAAFAFSLAGKLLLIWFFPPGYRSVAAITPLIAASIVFFGVYNVVMVGAGVRRKPWMGGVFATIAAVANL
ncbi:MAG TPA: lipopolysaccharide biosynthesis protein, partial [Ktedonobacterales bacterium]